MSPDRCHKVSDRQINPGLTRRGEALDANASLDAGFSTVKPSLMAYACAVAPGRAAAQAHWPNNSIFAAHSYVCLMTDQSNCGA
jgi:hypothetical protein